MTWQGQPPLTLRIYMTKSQLLRRYTPLISVNKAMNGWSYLQSVSPLFSPSDTLTRQDNKTRQEDNKMMTMACLPLIIYIKDSTTMSLGGFQAAHGPIVDSK